MRTNLTWRKLGFVAALICCMEFVFAADSVPFLSHRHNEALQKMREQANAYTEKHLNRFALDEMQRYDQMLDSFYREEIRDTLKQLNSNYKNTHASRTRTLDSLNSKIKILNDQKAQSQVSFNTALRKTGIAAAIWLVIILVLMRIRNLAVKRSNEKLEQSRAQLALSEARRAEGLSLIDFVK